MYGEVVLLLCKLFLCLNVEVYSKLLVCDCVKGIVMSSQCHVCVMHAQFVHTKILLLINKIRSLQLCYSYIYMK